MNFVIFTQKDLLGLKIKILQFLGIQSNQTVFSKDWNIFENVFSCISVIFSNEQFD